MDRVSADAHVPHYGLIQDSRGSGYRADIYHFQIKGTIKDTRVTINGTLRKHRNPSIPTSASVNARATAMAVETNAEIAERVGVAEALLRRHPQA